ncbi:superoxide dismutase family protein [Paenibacillus sp. FJAT-27812]|uniref:superoxide dismutase family protein n=1 Tax=Paenibacillus sp. FJAT-27812 TaxID=1684143 RepID=UPI0006A7DCA1|nr:superoxide dismutase family protein [Paenibacillus sp. FJAT-27812]
MKKTILFACLILSALAIGTAMTPSNSNALTVKIINGEGKEIGTAELTQKKNKVFIQVEAENLAPGTHGIHIHAVGKCDVPDFTTAGAHFNPQNKQHGFHNPKGFHDGDLPNIEVGVDGKVKAMLTSETVTLARGQSNSLFQPEGTSLVIHEKADDYVTDPSGNSGNRIACAVIK